ncbi:DUF551 domain-containing protein [Klebsiella pneumoniae]|nr:DUF551 domain-containing protein [Klebsiella pneumoniae]MDE8415895.1 DUF551 domain-containing protein [Klebsiella pneumoniae]
MALAAMDSSESVELPLDYLQGHKDGLEWAAKLAEANHPETGDWLYDDHIELAKAIRKGPDMPPVQPVADSEPVAVNDDMAYAFHHALTDSMIGADDVEEIKTGLRAVFANLTAPVVSAEYPDRLPCSVLLEPGMRFGKGIKTSTMLAAMARRAVYESDMAALSQEERAEFQTRIEDFKSLIAQQAPAVPDERDKTVDADDHPLLWSFNKGWNACRAAMLQELKKSAGTEAICRSDENVQVLHTKSPAQSDCCPAQNSVTPAQNQGWIPVSERMPENDGAYLCWDNRYVTTYAFIFGAWQANQFIAKNITHWMPLPAGPQEVR